MIRLSILYIIIALLSGCSFKNANSDLQKPNVLFIAVDYLNDWEGALGGNSQAITPHMDKLFDQGILFTNAHCSQAVCAASRNSLLSGIHPSTSGWYGFNGLRESYDSVMQEHKMLPQYFKDNGYKTMAVGKIFHTGVTDYNDKIDAFWNEAAPRYIVPMDLAKRGDGYGGEDGNMYYPFPKGGSQIVNHYGEDYGKGHSLCYGALDTEDMPEGKMFDEFTANWGINQLNKDHDKPFFLALGFIRPHVPYTAPRQYFDMYNFDEIKIPNVPEQEMSDIPNMGKSIAYGTLKTGDHNTVVNLSDTYWKELVYGYLACVSFVDAQIGKVIEALENSKYAENTIVVLWSDHGQHLGEKKHWRKQALWEESTKVPLFIKTPGQKTGDKCSQVVSLLDIYPTLLDLCGLPHASKLEGDVLTPLIENPKMKWDKPVLNSWQYGNFAVRNNKWRYIQYRDGSQELYNHENDPGEHNNLAEDESYSEIIMELKKWIPLNPALPATTTEWTGDGIDKRIKEWVKNDSIPVWLR